MLGTTLFFPDNKRTFQPNQIAGNELWLDAADTSTITSSGGLVSQWNDKSGRGNHAVQATGAQQPTTGSFTINGKNVIGFAGNVSSQWMKILSMSCTGNTLMIVYRTTESTFSEYCGAFGCRTSASTKVPDSTVGFGFTGVYANTTICQMAAVTTVSAFIDGNSVSTANFDNFAVGVSNAPMANTHVLITTDNQSSGTANCCIGADTFTAIGTRHWNGYICEIALYSTALSTSNITILTAYAKRKWGIS